MWYLAIIRSSVPGRLNDGLTFQRHGIDIPETASYRVRGKTPSMTTADPTFAMSPPARETSVEQDVADVARFFGLHVTGHLMTELTRASAKTLDRASKGEHVEYRPHLRVVADFVRESRAYLLGVATWDEWTAQDQHDMLAWLDNGRISLRGHTYTPHEILADEVLARTALSELLRVTE